MRNTSTTRRPSPTMLVLPPECRSRTISATVTPRMTASRAWIPSRVIPEKCAAGTPSSGTKTTAAVTSPMTTDSPDDSGRWTGCTRGIFPAWRALNGRTPMTSPAVAVLPGLPDAQGGEHALEVSDGVGPAPAAVGLGGRVHPGVRVADHGRDVVVDDEPVEADGVQAGDDPGRVVVALAEEALGEGQHAALDVAEVNVADRPVCPQGVDDAVDGGLAAHLGDRAEAEVQPPRRAVARLLAGGAQRVGCGEDARRAAERHVDRGVIRVQGEPDAVFLGDRQHRVEEVLVVGPHLVGADRLGQRFPGGKPVSLQGVTLPRLREVEGGDLGAATPVVEHAGAPDERRQEVVAEDLDTDGGHVADGGAVVFDLLVAARQAALDLPEVGQRHVLEAVDRQPVRVAPLPEGPELGEAPVAVLAGQQVGGVQMDAAQAELAREGGDPAVVLVDVPEG